MTGSCFVTGTDTACGKTAVSLGLMWALQQRGLRALGMKPVASGSRVTAEGLRNDDALRLQAQGSWPLPYAAVNPYPFEPPIAPHIAAQQAGLEIELARLRRAYRELAAAADAVIVEGVGGWHVPLGPATAIADLVRELDLPVLLVVGLRLGCLNHALLSVESILGSAVPLAGWVATQVERDMRVRDENLATLEARIAAPCLGVVPWLESVTPAAVGRCLAASLHFGERH